ncbi:MAG: outer membrane beta-barrel domain-containing protein [Deltaproteobacteria bacterium]|nr:MAG: outer membrane beta-barrel domain-containing protein [Deltaproteobacteria bacterium]
MNRVKVALALLFAAAWAGEAAAVGPSSEVVQERLYTFNGRFDLTVLGGISLNNKLHDHYGVALLPAFHFTDAWALELTGGYFLGIEKRRLTNSADAFSPGIRKNIADNDGLNDEFSGMGTLTWVAEGALRWSPIYGKLSLAAELPLHVGAYVAVGGGFVGVQRVSLVDCTNVVDSDGDGFVEATCTTENSAKPSGMFALGLRFYLSDWLALRAEVRDILFPDRYRLDIGTAEERTVSGIQSVLLFMGGASFYF